MITTILVLIVLLYFFIKLTVDPFYRKCKCTAKLDGKVVLVTGGNTGIGLETARDLAKRGASVIIASTNVKKSESAVQDIINTTGNKAVEHKYMNLASFKSIREFVEDFNKSYDRLDILVNNAGCFGAENKPTEDGIDKVMQINYFGPFLLTNLLLPKLIKSKPSRIVVVSSIAQLLVLKFDIENLNGLQKGWLRNHLGRYNNSKFCQILWMKALEKRLPEGVTINALHPGGVKTGLFTKLAPVWRELVAFAASLYFINAEQGAQTSIHLCVAEELANKSGSYYAACKPNWLSFALNDKLVEKVWNESVKMTKSNFNEATY